MEERKDEAQDLPPPPSPVSWADLTSSWSSEGAGLQAVQVERVAQSVPQKDDIEKELSPAPAPVSESDTDVRSEAPVKKAEEQAGKQAEEQARRKAEVEEAEARAKRRVEQKAEAEQQARRKAEGEAWRAAKAKKEEQALEAQRRLFEKQTEERRAKNRANEHTWLWYGLAFFFLCGGLLAIALAFFAMNASIPGTTGGGKFSGLRRIDSDSGFGLSRSRSTRTPQSPRQRPVMPGVGALRARHPFAGLSPRSAV